MIGIGIIAAYYPVAEYRANKRGMDVDMILDRDLRCCMWNFRCKLLYYVTIFDRFW